MAKTIIVAGFGPGISTGVAEQFGKQGFTVALVGRSAQRLTEGVQALDAQGIQAAAFPGDLSDPESVKKVVADVRAQLDPVSVLEWNAYSLAAGDLLTASSADVHGQFGVSVTGLLTAVQELLPDLKQEQGAVLVANGPIALNGEPFDSTAAEYGFMGMALAAAAKHKLVGLLVPKLAQEGIYIGEVMVYAAVKGTPGDTGNPTIPTIDPATIGRAIWDAYTARSAVITDVN